MHKVKLLIKLVHLCVIQSCACSTFPKIAIVGGGIGGASSAYFLRHLFGKNVALHLYEPNDIGGRMATVKIASRKYEAGGSIIHPSNSYVLEFSELLGLKKRDTSPGILGIYDGKKYVFKESSWDIVTFLRLLWRYGTDVMKLKSLISGMMQHFSKIYELQGNGNAYTTVEKLLNAMSPEFVNATTQKTIYEVLKEKFFSERFIEEVAAAVMRVNYGQDTDIGGFVGSVSLAGAEPGLWSVYGGNKNVPKKLLEISDVIKSNQAVRQIALLPNQKFSVMTEKNLTSYFDMVVVAVPLIRGVSDISFKDFPIELETGSGTYHRTVATFVDGELNRTAVGLSVDDDVNEILVNVPGLFYNSVGKLYPVDYCKNEKVPNVWKIFSSKILEKDDLERLFPTVRDVKWVDWLAYPHYVVPCRLSKFNLYPGLFYTSSIEWAASAMEMSAIAGRNVALLAYGHWTSYKNVTVDSIRNANSALKNEL